MHQIISFLPFIGGLFMIDLVSFGLSSTYKLTFYIVQLIK